MRKRFQVRMNRHLVIKDCLVQSSAVVSALPNGAMMISAHQNSINALFVLSESLTADKGGVKLATEMLRKIIHQQMSELGKKLFAMAKFANNQVLMKEMTFTDSKIKRLSSVEFRDLAQLIYTRASTNLTGLATYGVNAAGLTSFQTNITGFVTASPKFRAAKNDVKIGFQQFEEALNAADLAIENIDALVETVRYTQPVFYRNYKEASKLVDIPTGSIALMGCVVDENGNPITKAKLVITPLSIAGATDAKGEVKPIVKQTALKGRCMVKSLLEGVYEVLVTKVGYQDQLIKVVVTKGEMCKVNVQLSKAA